MPLVIFNYYWDDLQEDFNNLSGIEAEIRHTRTLSVPRDAMKAKWKLVAINANFNNDEDTDWIGLDVELPELMTTDNILFSNVALGDTTLPKNALRFYTGLRQLSERSVAPFPRHRESSGYGHVSEYPNWDLGEVELDTTELSCTVTPRMGNVADNHQDIQLNGVSIILSYEQ